MGSLSDTSRINTFSTPHCLDTLIFSALKWALRIAPHQVCIQRIQVCIHIRLNLDKKFNPNSLCGKENSEHTSHLPKGLLLGKLLPSFTHHSHWERNIWLVVRAAPGPASGAAPSPSEDQTIRTKGKTLTCGCSAGLKTAGAIQRKHY